MPEQLEIEAKFILADPVQTRSTLLALGAVSQDVHSEINIRLDDADFRLSAQRQVLRLREQEKAGVRAYIMTVKMPDSNAEQAISVRREIELAVSDGDALLAALEVLGYTPYMSYEKRRETFTLGSVEIVLDEVPVGVFLEIEGSEIDIREVVSQLGLDLTEALGFSYSEIFERVCRALERDSHVMTFEAFADVDIAPDFVREVLST